MARMSKEVAIKKMCQELVTDESVDSIRKHAISVIDYRAKYGTKNMADALVRIEDNSLFYCHAYALGPQRFGPLVEKRMIRKLNRKRVESKENKGDDYGIKGSIEYKVSILTPPKWAGNICQIRHHAEIDYYIVIFVIWDNILKKFEAEYFLLTKEEMKKEDALLGHSCHGTEEVCLDNKKNERRITIVNQSADHLRWKKNYLKTFSQLEQLFKES